jgi:hypothetical protein
LKILKKKKGKKKWGAGKSWRLADISIGFNDYSEYREQRQSEQAHRVDKEI